MPDASDFAKMVPGYDFFQGLMKGAGASLPQMGQWIAPTLNPEELEKRIDELRTVQFWLEQNARLLGATIQALEVQRITLTTLKTLNLPLADLQQAMKLRMPEPAPAPTPVPVPAVAEISEAAPAPSAPAGVVDPVQWWGALTQQFTELATHAMKDSGAEAARNLAGAVVQQTIDVAGKTLKSAVGAPVTAVKAAAATKRAARPAAARKKAAR